MSHIKSHIYSDGSKSCPAFVYSLSQVSAHDLTYLTPPAKHIGFLPHLIPKIEKDFDYDFTSPMFLKENNFSNFNRRLFLDGLPFEIRELIAQHSLQADALHLCLVNKAMYGSTIKRLYECIIFDSSEIIFNNETSQNRVMNSGERLAYTKVRTVGGLRECLRALQGSSLRCEWVRRFECLNCPDLPDYEINSALKSIFPKMAQLEFFIWNCSPEMTVGMLQYFSLDTLAKLNTLSLEMALRADLATRQLPTLLFENLKHLSLRPYVSSEFLVLIAKMIINSDIKSTLQTLHIGRELPLRGQRIISAFASFIPHRLNTEDYGACKAFFKTLSEGNVKLNLDRLELDGLRTCGSCDAQYLLETVDFGKLAMLRLSGVDKGDQYGYKFLSALEGKLPNLRVLDLDWTEERDINPVFTRTNIPWGYSSIPDFISSMNGIESLKLEIPEFSSSVHDNGEVNNRELWYENRREIFYSINKFAPTLTNISIGTSDTSKGNSIRGYRKPSEVPLEYLTCLMTMCTSLVGVSIAVALNGDIAQKCSKILTFLPKTVKYLEFKNVGIPSRANCLVGGSVFEEMGSGSTKRPEAYHLSVIGSVVKWAPSIEYVKVAEVVFDIRSKNRPPVVRDGLDSWLDSKIVRDISEVFFN
ncbi:hypothetical protein NADFUDRAFT_51242 [Nadsonia fulvescens var. elongata DSM 6958]|uniref:F-box domain-containing protein n=1 Tax=Nadsonia fulvescens var. elongata DSM 6958 TaxID=857566 RepID=A0A1E3PKK7_9ASCO|nr:hypothetical protein NADFUDRAFT_51242 [Nadsonia fulvescens var. elongata DSM 6958]